MRTHLVQGVCCNNPSKREQIYSEELQGIAKRHFKRLKGGPKSNNLGFKTEKNKGNAYDTLIRAWTRFWNGVFKSGDPLDPDLVKALVASESGFNPVKVIKVGSRRGSAHGLMQITDETQRVLGDKNGELKDYLVHVDQQDLTDANLNIAAGVRWLFYKKKLARQRLKREATWDESVAEYKGVLGALVKSPNKVPRDMRPFRKYYGLLKKK